MRAEIVISAQR